MDLPFVVFALVLVFNRLSLLTCKSTYLFSVLHLAVSLGSEQLVDQVLQLTEQMHFTKQLTDSQGDFGYVSDL